MIYLTSYSDGDKFFCRIRFSGDGFEFSASGKSFWGTFLSCFIKGSFLKLKLKIKNLLGNGKSVKNSSFRDVCTTNKH